MPQDDRYLPLLHAMAPVCRYRLRRALDRASLFRPLPWVWALLFGLQPKSQSHARLGAVDVRAVFRERGGPRSVVIENFVHICTLFDGFVANDVAVQVACRPTNRFKA
jgi:hypothetical protein